MNIIIQYFSAFAIHVFALTGVSYVAIAQENTTILQQKLCSFDAVEKLLPPIASQQTSSPLSYLSQEGFVQDSDGSWVCYISDPKKEWRYYTLFKVQQTGGKLIASSFLENGKLVDGQENRSLDLFIMLLEKNVSSIGQENRQSIRRYLEAFISLVKQGKVPPLPRGYLFDQPHRGFVSYHPLTGSKFQGTAITININISKNPTK
ncbi:hypothetical protein NUACC21_48800 [Scytonema sp. NUACC21]